MMFTWYTKAESMPHWNPSFEIIPTTCMISLLVRHLQLTSSIVHYKRSSRITSLPVRNVFSIFHILERQFLYVCQRDPSPFKTCSVRISISKLFWQLINKVSAQSYATVLWVINILAMQRCDFSSYTVWEYDWLLCTLFKRHDFMVHALNLIVAGIVIKCLCYKLVCV